ncbi:MAG: prepilin-type N-terminal cleavage/methylation domain-containing protein [Terriglobia bacterium]
MPGPIILRERQSGFTLVETLVALLLLSMSLLALAMLFPLGVRLSAQSSVASAAIQIAQCELEQIRNNIFSPSGSYTDANGNALEASCQGAPGTSCGNPLTSSRMIDYSSPAAVGYSVTLQDSLGTRYDIRWNVTITYNYGREIILASKPINPTAAGLPLPVQIETIVGQPCYWNGHP